MTAETNVLQIEFGPSRRRSHMSVGRWQLVSRAFFLGPKYMAIGAAIPAAVLAFLWADGAVSLVLLLVAMVPAAVLAGATLGLVLFPIAHLIVGALRIPVASWTVVHSILLGVLGYVATLPFAVWVAGDLAKAVTGHQGTHLVLIPAALVGLASGAMFGAAMQRYAEKSGQNAIEQDSAS